jgi:hypothetical protein
MDAFSEEKKVKLWVILTKLSFFLFIITLKSKVSVGGCKILQHDDMNLFS